MDEFHRWLVDERLFFKRAVHHVLLFLAGEAGAKFLVHVSGFHFQKTRVDIGQGVFGQLIQEIGIDDVELEEVDPHFGGQVWIIIVEILEVEEVVDVQSVWT
jgi:hypothetical protein